jgi:methylmalonyl-CoA carboxyltransferase large subunit
MNTETPSLADVANALAAIQAELARMGERIAALEAAPGRPTSVPVPTPAAASSRDGEVLSDETILVIGAAIAAFLGKKAHIRQIRLLGSAAWAQQGRVTIQASHALSTARSQP